MATSRQPDGGQTEIQVERDGCQRPDVILEWVKIDGLWVLQIRTRSLLPTAYKLECVRLS